MTLYSMYGGGWRKSSRWLDGHVKEHMLLRRASNTLLLSAASAYMLDEKEPFEQVLPIYIEFGHAFISHHERSEEALAALTELLGSFTKRYVFRLFRDLKDAHLTIEYRFKDLIEAQTYAPEDLGRELASRAAIYYETTEDHREDEERILLPKILGIMLKAGCCAQEISQALEENKAKLREGFHERAISLVNKMEERISSAILKSSAVAMNITGLKPYEMRTATKEKIRENKDKRIYRLILINDHDPVPLYHELLNTESCIDQNFFRAEQLSNRIWASMIVLREGCR
ncbi:MAG: hypothetical protein QXQ96_00100 [Sulfolobales archaeon]